MRIKEMAISHKIDVAGARRKCFRCGPDKILKGDRFLSVKAGLAWKGYCLKCARMMLVRSVEQLTATLKQVEALA